MIHLKIDLLISLLLLISWTSFVTILPPIVIVIYYISKLKLDVIDKKFNGSWKSYLKAIVGKK